MPNTIKLQGFLFTAFMVMQFVSLGQSSNPFKWLEGQWTMKAGNNLITESWRLVNDSALEGKSAFIKNGKDTIPQETIQLLKKEGEWYYIPTVQGQNNNQPVSFKIIFMRGTEFISENPTHDFPQRIAYRRVNQTIFASIEGRKNGKFGKQNFDYVLQ